MIRKITALVLVLIVEITLLSTMEAKSLQLKKNITGTGLSPKSVVHAGKGLFFAQNMMYNHNISVYNRNFERVKIINDAVDLSKFGIKGHAGLLMGAPVECAFSHNGLFAWVSNYQMYGKGFKNAGEDNCRTSNGYDHSYLYKINTKSLAIEDVVQVGAVPKYVATTPDSRYVLVSNWCSGDVTIIDSQLGQAVRSVLLGAHPRGIVVDSHSEQAYVAVMGSNKIGIIDLKDFSVSWITNVGSTPRHLCISPDNKYLYVTLNSEGKVAKIDLNTSKVVAKVSTGRAPRSMAMLGDGAYLYVVNYLSNTLSKVRAADMKVMETIATKDKPIGVTTDAEAQTIWVACYSGNIMVFHDNDLNPTALAGSYKPNDVFNYNSKITPVTAPLPLVQTTIKPKNSLPNPLINSNINKKLITATPPTKILTKPQPTTPSPTAKTVQKNGYYIIIESSTSRVKAEQSLKQWKAQGATNVQIVVANNLYRIASHYYKTKAEANKAVVQVKAKYKSSAWILEHS